jgi:hypothetical protein
MSESSLPGTFACAGASAAGSQIADAIGPILNEIVDRFGRGQRVAVDRALRRRIAGRLTQKVCASRRAPVIADFCNKIGQLQTSRSIPSDW